VFIELTELLRCPEDHPEEHQILATATMMGRNVVRGVVGCPACRREYPVDDGIIRFGQPPHLAASDGVADAATVQALLGVASPGGSVALVGSAARLAPGLSRLLGAVHLVAVNPPADVEPGQALSVMMATAMIPLRTSVTRGVVLGEEYALPPWTAEAVRVLLPGLRLVVLAEGVGIAGLEQLAAGNGMWVGQKARGGRS
jgi:uncharacterized protein YbaR (Trm112 family)